MSSLTERASMTQQMRSESERPARLAQGEPAGRGAAALQFATPLAAQARDLNQNPRVQANQSLQAKLDGAPSVVAQAKLSDALSGQAAQRMADRGASALTNRTGLPDRLKAGVEQLSGTSLDGVRVHYNSARPAQLRASAFTQGSDIHVGPGQERHLPHEAWHAAQQLQGRVAPTTQLKGVALNDDAGLEHEADVMGARALQAPLAPPSGGPSTVAQAAGGPVQRYFDAPHDSEIDAVEEYVAEVRPDLLETFYQIDASDEPTDLYRWLNAQLHVNMHGVYDWQDGIVRGQPLRLGDEDVRGSGDIPEISDEELDEFRTGVDEADYTKEELEELHHQLRMRGAPHDRERRAILGEHAHSRPWPSRMDLGEEEEAGSEDEFEAPQFSDSEDDGSGTDTDGSDTEDDDSYGESEDRLAATTHRLKREAGLLKPHLVRRRLTELGKAMAVKSRVRKTGSKEKAKKLPTRGEAMRAAMFEGGKRPAKEVLFRKETKFRHPSVTVGDRAKLPVKPSPQQTLDLAQLNALLDLGVPIALAEQIVPSRFVVAQYRGLFYSRATFNQRSRAQHRGLDETNRPVFSSSALADGPLGTAGYYYLYGAGRQADLNTYQGLVAYEAQRIREALLALRSQPPQEDARVAVGRATDNFVPTSMSDISTHFYSQDYDAYHTALAEKLGRGEDEEQSPLDPLFEGLTNAANPKVSTGDVPTHAARYAYGLKPYSGHEHQILEPGYNDMGTPRHPYSGRMYVSLHPLTDYDESGPEQLIELQRQNRINIAQVILPERESPFEGMLGPGRVKKQMTAKFPDFSKDYKPVFAEKYGLSEDIFDAFKTALQDTAPGTDERVFVEALLSNYLAMHSEIRAIEAAMRMAGQQGAKLVYRTGPKSFGFEPTPMKGEGAPSSEPLDIKALLQVLVGEVTESSQGAPLNSLIREPVAAPYGEPIPINGRGFACYIRSLVTAAARLGYIGNGEIEDMVDTVQIHLAAQGLRNVGQDIDAGGLVAAEVRRVLAELLGGFDPQVHIVMDDEVNGWTEFTANTGTEPVYLQYTPGHFDLLPGPEG